MDPYKSNFSFNEHWKCVVVCLSAETPPVFPYVLVVLVCVGCFRVALYGPSEQHGHESVESLIGHDMASFRSYSNGRQSSESDWCPTQQ